MRYNIPVILENNDIDTPYKIYEIGNTEEKELREVLSKNRNISIFWAQMTVDGMYYCKDTIWTTEKQDATHIIEI